MLVVGDGGLVHHNGEEHDICQRDHAADHRNDPEFHLEHGNQQHKGDDLHEDADKRDALDGRPPLVIRLILRQQRADVALREALHALLLALDAVGGLLRFAAEEDAPDQIAQDRIIDEREPHREQGEEN